MLAFLCWVLLAVVLVVILSHRLILVSVLKDFEVHRKTLVSACGSYNRFLLWELVLYTFYTIGTVIFPSRFVLLFVVNAPLVLWDWRSYFVEQFFLSPFQIVRAKTRHDTVCGVHLALFFVNTPFLLWRLFSTAFLRPTVVPH